MTDGTVDVSRRAFLRTAAGSTTAAAAAGTAAAQENDSEGGDGGDGGGGGGEPDYGGWFDDVSNFDGTVDARGQDTVTVQVGVQANGGAFGFGPAAVHVDNGATVQWEWTGQGGGHNVVGQEGTLDSGDPVAEAGVHYEHTFDQDGLYQYVCVPHEALGMKGAVVVGEDYPSTGGGDGGGDGGGGGGLTIPNSAKTLGVATSFVMIATLGLAYFFLKYGGDYREPGAE